MIVSASLNIPLAVAVYYLDNSLLKAFLYFYSSMYFCIGVLIHIAYSSSLYWRVASVANILKNLSNHSHTKRGIMVVESEDIDVILMGLIEIYVDLIEICHLVNICTGLSTLLGFGLIFFHSLFTFFVVFKEAFLEGSIPVATVSGILYLIYYNFLFTSFIFLNGFKDREVSFYNNFFID